MPAQLDELFVIAETTGIAPDVLAVARVLWRELKDTLLHD
jgi:hypothetical protein